MKKLLLSLSVIGTMATLCGCNNKVNPEELAIIGPEFIGVNNTFTYKVETNPVAAKKDVVWSVDNEDIASIDQNGKLTPNTEGTIKVNIKSKVNENIASSLNVKIYKTLDTNNEFLANYKNLYTTVSSKPQCSANVNAGDFIISTYGKVTAFSDCNFKVDSSVPKFFYSFQNIEKKTDNIPIKNDVKLKENFDIIEQHKTIAGKDGEIFLKIDKGISSYFTYLNTGKLQEFEFKSFDSEGYLIRHKEVLFDGENYQTLENFHITYNK